MINYFQNHQNNAILYLAHRRVVITHSTLSRPSPVSVLLLFNYFKIKTNHKRNKYHSKVWY